MRDGVKVELGFSWWVLASLSGTGCETDGGS